MQKHCLVPPIPASLLFVSLFLSFLPLSTLRAQQTNPLINSGELIARGSQLHDSGEYKKAIASYSQVDRNDTNYIWSLYERAYTYSADSQYNKSLACCEKALSQGSDASREPELYNQYGSTLDALGQPERAIRVFDSAIQKYPAYSLLYLNKGITLMNQKKYQEAEADFKKVLLIDPYSYSSHYRLAISALQQGKLIPAFLGLVGYLMMTPEGRFRGSAIHLLNAIAHNEDNIQQYVNGRKETPSDNYLLLEQILQSKIALDKSYKPLIHLDDAISRQIQVIFEKMEYDGSDNDFWVQYYMPFFKDVFTAGTFEAFINHCFAGVDVQEIKDYNKKYKKEINAMIEQAATYFGRIRATRELNVSKRSADDAIWLYSDSKAFGRGKYLKKEDKLTGPWVFYYAPGNKRATGTYDDQGHKIGQWTYYYFNGQLKGNELYQNGKQEGEETYYYPDGQPSTHTWYKNNLPDGEGTSYNLVGMPKATAHYKAGKEEGEKLTYFSSGGISYVENFTAGTLNGLSQSRFQNGQLEYTVSYTNGKLEGPYKKYFDNGQLAEEGIYTKDKQEGIWKYYFANGQFKGEFNFIDGKEDGAYKEYHENGKIHLTSNYRKGKVIGEALYYDLDEKLFSSLLFENDLLKTAKYFDKTGKLVSQSDRKGEFMDLITMSPDGNKRSSARYDGKWNQTGTETFYYPTGDISETDEYLNGVEEGPSIAYYPNGRKKVANNYSAGKKDGYHQIFFNHGQVQEEGWYVAGLSQGYWITHNEMGDLTDSTYYLDDKISGYRTEYSPNGKQEYESRYKSGWLQEITQYDSTGSVLAHLQFPGGSGKYTLVYPDGKPYIETVYKNGHLDGTRHVWYFDHKPMLVEYYKAGIIDSISRSYYYSGQISMEGSYRLGSKTGTWKSYWQNGKLSHQEIYKNGKQDGIRSDYSEDGKLESEIMYADDDRNGFSKKYDPDGTLIYQIEFRDDKAVSYTWPDRNGQLLPPTPIPQNTGKVRTYFSNGRVSASFTYNNGAINGPDSLFYSNGNLRTCRRQENGNIEGSNKTYYPDGRIKHDYVYLHDNLQGQYKEYNDKGILTEEGTFYNGQANGFIKQYNDQGTLIETDFYYYGKLLSVKK